MNHRRQYTEKTEERADESRDGYGYPSQSNSADLAQNRLLMGLISRWYWIALLGIIGMLAGFFYYDKAPKFYLAESQIVISLPERGINGASSNAAGIDATTVEGLNTILNRIFRTSLLARVAARQDVQALEEFALPETEWRPTWWLKWTNTTIVEEVAKNARQMPTNEIIEIIVEHMTAEVVDKTRLINLGFKHTNANCAKVVANAIAVEYVAEAEETARIGTSDITNSIGEKTKENQNALSEAHGALANYAQAMIIQKELEEAESDYTTLSLRYKPKHPDMVVARANLENAQRRFISELKIAMSNPVDATYWKKTTPMLEAHKNQPDEYLNAVRQALTSRMSALDAQARSLQELIKTMIMGSGGLNIAPKATSISVNQMASLPDELSDPSKLKVLGIATFAGLALGFLLALVFTKMDNSFHTVAELESETDVQVLAAIPAIPLNHINAVMAHAKKKGKADEENEHQKKWEPRLLFRAALKKTNYCESFRILRASVTLLGDENTRKITLITSSLPGEGKSTVSTNLALASAAQGRKTLLIDFDLRKPRLHQVFGISEKPLPVPGASDWCARTAPLVDCITTDVGAENLHVIFSGKRSPDPGELLDPDRIRELLAEVSDLYDSIIIDSAPLLAVPDTRLIAPFADNLCLVVRSNWVPKGAVFRSLDLLESYGTSPSGLIMNGHAETRKRINQNYSYGSYRISRFGKAYQYGYGSYGSYGSYGAEDDDDDEIPQKKSKSRRH